MQQLRPQFIQNVLSEQCFVSLSDKLLLAVSGGADSMALLHLLHTLDYEIAAVHCNFNLRAQDSDSDEQLVRSYCSVNSIPLYVESFATKAYAEEKGISIEMAARDLRYARFNELKIKHNCQAVVTGHHGNDSIETFFLNLVRGTGIKGLSGIRFRNGDIVRPLLDFSRADIEAYCIEHAIVFVHDKSNDDTRFTRNKIRHEIIPVLETLNPSFFETMQANMAHIKEAECILSSEVERFRASMPIDEHAKVTIPISKFDKFPQYKTILFELLRPYGFNTAVVNDIAKHLRGRSGKQFFSRTHRLIKDRHNLLIIPQQKEGVRCFRLEEGGSELPVKTQVKRFAKKNAFKFSRDPKLIHLDADLINLPLLVRRWQHGDVFIPLGMKGFKKVSDYFIDKKYSLADKEEAWLMVDGDHIVGLLGRRLDDRFKVSNRTKNILEIRLL